MIDFVSTFVEAAAGYLVGRYNTKENSAKNIALIAISFACGMFFFVIFGIYEIIWPAPNPKGNIWLGLTIISMALALIIYVILMIDTFIKKKNR